MLGDDTRKPNRLTLTPETLLTPAALHEAEAEELKLKNRRSKDWDVVHHREVSIERPSSEVSWIRDAVESKIEEVDAGFARKPTFSLDCQFTGPESTS